MFSKTRRRHKLEVGPIETTTIGGEIIFIAPKTAAAGGCGPPLIFMPSNTLEVACLACHWFLPPLNPHLWARQTLNTNCQERCHYERCDVWSGQFFEYILHPITSELPDTKRPPCWRVTRKPKTDACCSLPSLHFSWAVSSSGEGDRHHEGREQGGEGQTAVLMEWDWGFQCEKILPGKNGYCC